MNYHQSATKVAFYVSIILYFYYVNY